ncbi:MAG: hypothetical protein JWO58_851 [Chitinophagaceae bacterium]|nr:hypothetical protein [Chitinophagaceae bacterium]
MKHLRPFTFIVASLALIVCMSFTTAEKWVTVHVKKYGYKVAFPKKPTEQTQKINSAVGDLQLNMYLYDASEAIADDNLLYLTNCTVYPEALRSTITAENLDVFYRQAIDGAVKNVEGKLLSEKRVDLDGHEGREATVDYQNGLAVITLRLFLINGNMYMIQTIAETSKAPNASSQKFFDSFQLLK